MPTDLINNTRMVLVERARELEGLHDGMIAYFGATSVRVSSYLLSFTQMGDTVTRTCCPSTASGFIRGGHGCRTEIEGAGATSAARCAAAQLRCGAGPGRPAYRGGAPGRVRSGERDGVSAVSVCSSASMYRPDGRQTLLIVDEGWLALDQEGFTGQLRD